MKRTILGVVASSMLLLIGPGAALARQHGHGHSHKSHHQRSHRAHARSEKLGSDFADKSGEIAGTVASFKDGVLTIKLMDGSTVSGKVTAATKLECESSAPMVAHSASVDPGARHDSTPGDARHTGDAAAEVETPEVEAPEAEMACDSSALVAGAVVREAELNVSSSGSVFTKIELMK
jgi:hypothetical protein